MARFDFSFASKANGANSSAGDAVPAENRERRFNTDDVSKQLLRVLTPLHVDSLSLHDASGELQWLNEGAFGPDEHGVVTDALDVFALDPAREDLQLKLDNDRSALVACARDANAELLGIALVIVETPTSEEISGKLSGPRVVALVRRFAQLLAPTPPAAAAVVMQAAATTPVAVAATATKATTAAAPEPASAEFTPELTLADQAPRGTAPSAAPVRTERRANPAPSGKPTLSSDTIHAHRYARLRAGGAARRYEVKPAANASFAADLMLANHVVKHLQRSGDRYTQTPSSFVLPLSVQSVIEDGWLAQLQPRLTRAGLPDGLVGFCLPAAAWQQQHEASERFIAQCEKAHCFVALDDFTLGNTGLALLRSSAVKCLKIEAQLIAAVVQDKFAHANLAAIVQAARVLGLYCVAKKVASASQVKWLAAAGIEFADGVSRGVAAAATKSEDALSLRLDE